VANDGPAIFGLLAMFLMAALGSAATTCAGSGWWPAARCHHPVRPPAPPDRTADGRGPRLLGGGGGDRRTAARRRRGKLGRQPAGARLCAPRRPWNGRQPSRWNLPARLAIKRNSVLATVTPGQGTSTVTLLFEPDAGWWADLLALDEGSNFENAEAVTRAISRRVADQRRDEQAAAEQTQVEKELSVARLNLLHAQVEPHFLYNTLANAQVLTRTDRHVPNRCSATSSSTCAARCRVDESVSTLGVELERTRPTWKSCASAWAHGWRWDAGTERTARRALPAMALQTLVENAIKHGLEPKPGGGTIWILARGFDDHVTVTVADDGLGFGQGTSGTGIGLKNLRERLRLTCGEQAGVAIVANFPSGVAATMTLPQSHKESSHAA
jgi:hypothetical protein